MKKLISWLEVPAVNFDRAVRFYSSVFNLNMEKIDCGEEKMACFPGGEGAVSYAPNFNPSSDGLLVSFNVSDNLESTILRIEENGGKIVQPKTKIEAEGRGYFAVFIDCEGNKVGLYADE